jgi:hypothetical protein
MLCQPLLLPPLVARPARRQSGYLVRLLLNRPQHVMYVHALTSLSQSLPFHVIPVNPTQSGCITRNPAYLEQDVGCLRGTWIAEENATVAIFKTWKGHSVAIKSRSKKRKKEG